MTASPSIAPTASTASTGAVDDASAPTMKRKEGIRKLQPLAKNPVLTTKADEPSEPLDEQRTEAVTRINTEEQRETSTDVVERRAEDIGKSFSILMGSVANYAAKTLDVVTDGAERMKPEIERVATESVQRASENVAYVSNIITSIGKQEEPAKPEIQQRDAIEIEQVDGMQIAIEGKEFDDEQVAEESAYNREAVVIERVTSTYNEGVAEVSRMYEAQVSVAEHFYKEKLAELAVIENTVQQSVRNLIGKGEETEVKEHVITKCEETPRASPALPLIEDEVEEGGEKTTAVDKSIATNVKDADTEKTILRIKELLKETYGTQMLEQDLTRRSAVVLEQYKGREQLLIAALEKKKVLAQYADKEQRLTSSLPVQGGPNQDKTETSTCNNLSLVFDIISY